MNNFALIRETLKDYDINIDFVRGTKENYKDNYLSSFYITNWHIKRCHIEYKINGKGYIVSILNEFIEDNNYHNIFNLLSLIKGTITYNININKEIRKLPDEIKVATKKYEESNKIDNNKAIAGLYSIAENALNNIAKNQYFEKSENYRQELLILQLLIEDIIKNQYNNESINNFKNYYEKNKKYLTNYTADFTPIEKELKACNELIFALFNEIRSKGVTTCDADVYIDNKKNNIENTLNYQEVKFKDPQYKSIYIFKDNSILFETNEGNLIEVRDNDHLDDIKVEIMINSINEGFEKYPVIETTFKNSLINNPIYINRIMGIATRYKQYNPILKEEEFNIINEMRMYTKKVNECDSLELISDKMRKIIKRHKVKKFAYSIASKKYKTLYNEKIMEMMETLYELKIEQSILQEYIGKNIAAYKTTDQFYDALLKMYNNYTKFKKDDVIESINKINSEIVYLDDNILICEIKSFKESNALGSASWCISREETYFNSYTKNNAKQYFVYNFNHKISNNENLIGVTLIDNVVRAACYRNNTTIKSNDKTLMETVSKIKNLT